jgi:hypothetical protein
VGFCIWYSEIKDISAFNFGPEFPFNIGLYDKCFLLLFVGYYATCNGYFIKPRILFSYLDWEIMHTCIFKQVFRIRMTCFVFLSSELYIYDTHWNGDCYIIWCHK